MACRARGIAVRLLHGTVATHEHEPRDGSKLVRAREHFRAMLNEH